MVKSMTGYGRAQSSDDKYNISVEIKAVNHRYFEFSLRTSRIYSFLEDKIKTYINQYVSRGKVECSLTIENLDESSSEVTFNKTLAESYCKALSDMSSSLSVSVTDKDIVSFLCRNPEVFSLKNKEIDEGTLWQSIKPVLDTAINNFVSMREIEGEKLKNDVLSRTDLIIEKVSFIEERSPQTVKEYNDKLLARLNEFLSDIHVDEQLVATECAIFADKVAVAEETVRLRSHIDQLHSLFDSNEAVGRKLDFLIQEMNRESNTIGSKASDLEIVRQVIDIKAEIEKIREQIQNIE